MSDAPLWTPSPARAAGSQLAAFQCLATERFGVAAGYAALHAWSIREPAQFWPLLWDWLGIVGERGERVITGDHFIDTRFFPDATLSFAENLLRRRDESIAVVAHAADGTRTELTTRALASQVAHVAAELRTLGIGAGDRVAGVLPNIPAALVAMLAANSLGAIWSLCDQEMGADAIVDRLGQIEPALLIAAESPRTEALLARLPSVRHTLRLPRLAELVAAGDATPTFVRQPFGAPAFILYTSGTTGLPKCIVHNTGGMLLQLAKENQLHYDVRPADRYCYQTSTGWNMWYWVAIALAGGATIVLREASPIRPRVEALFDLADAERLTHLGVSPQYLAQVRAANLRPRDTHRLADLRAVLSTGSPLSPALFDFVYDAVKPDVALISLSGGTEINACFVTGNPLAPVYRGEIQTAALGMASAVFDEDGTPIEHAKGELVCTQPFPSQPVGFWADPERARYRATYFERFPGAWHHGDFAETTPHDGWIIHGRSDSTLKPSGHRIGTAELYRQLEGIPQIIDAVAVAQRWADDVRIVLCVVLRPGAVLDAALERTIKTTILRNTSAHHVPARIVAVPEIPVTKTGKKAELAVRQAIHGEPVGNESALANPASLAAYRNLPALRR